MFVAFVMSRDLDTNFCLRRPFFRRCIILSLISRSIHNSIAFCGFIFFSNNMYSDTSSNYNHPSLSSSSSCWSQRTDMLTSAMRLVSISEDQTQEIGYASGNSSANSLRGWGSALSRKSCKADLSSLAQSNDAYEASCRQYEPSNMESSTIGDDWGFFVDAPSR
jgi:hypothetical protein